MSPSPSPSPLPKIHRTVSPAQHHKTDRSVHLPTHTHRGNFSNDCINCYIRDSHTDNANNPVGDLFCACAHDDKLTNYLYPLGDVVRFDESCITCGQIDSSCDANVRQDRPTRPAGRGNTREDDVDIDLGKLDVGTLVDLMLNTVNMGDVKNVHLDLRVQTNCFTYSGDSEPDCNEVVIEMHGRKIAKTLSVTRPQFEDGDQISLGHRQ